MKAKSLRYIVTGPGIQGGEEPSYADPGPAVSRTLTAAARKGTAEGATYYARDSITHEIIGHSERLALGRVVTRRTA